MAKKLPKFQQIDNPVALQGSLFMPSGVSAGKNPFPPILRDHQGVRDILEAIPNGVGFDLEFNPSTGRPTILGVANEERCAGVPWDAELCRQVIETAQRKKVKLIGHSVLGADRPIVEGATDIRTALGDWWDTMIGHYVTAPDLCKTPGKEQDDDDSGAMGFMGIWAMASLHTDLPNWKQHRGKACEGPCPLCDPFGYCAIDSWAAGPVAKKALEAEMGRLEIPQKLFDDLSHLSDICDRMQRTGIKVDRAYIDTMEKNFETKKLEYFPINTVNGKPVHTLFNPKSPKQVRDYFFSRGVQLESTERDEIRAVLEKTCKKHKVDFDQLGTAGRSEVEVVDSLYRLWQFKSAGKGLSSWFNDKYIGDFDLIHPRFIVPGTSMGRLASSGPNFQNIPARGFGALVRRAIVPRHPALDIIKVDYSQLELRMVLYLAGVDPRDIGADAFKWLVANSGGAFTRAAEMMGDTERQVAKSVAHGNSYLESFKVFSPRDMDTASFKNMVAAGAIRLYKDWEYCGGIVGFTGVNLSERIFGDKSWGNRKKALEIQEDVFNKAFPQIRQWQQKLLAEVETKGYVRSPIGRYLPLQGSPEDNAKMAAAFCGQGISADFVQEKMLRFDRERGIIALLQCHDELCWEVPSDWSDKRVTEHLQIMIDESYRLPGFVSALKIKRGPNWLEEDMHQIYPEI